LALVGPSAGVVSATQPNPDHKVTICHRTDSETNPYVVESVDSASVDGNAANDKGQGDHLLNHTGPVWYSGIPKEPKWGDIIPPFYADGTPDGLPSLNWDAAGQAIFNNGCNPSTGTTSTGTTSTGTTSTGTTLAPQTPSGSVLGATSSPKATGGVQGATSNPRVTPPPTDTLPTTGTPSGDIWRLVLLGLAALLASLLLLSPRGASPERSRR
jgi:hypothetical protein